MTIPEDIRDLFAWFLNYDERFRGMPIAAVAADFLRRGLLAEYEAGLKQATPLDEEVFNALAEHSLGSVKKSIEE